MKKFVICIALLAIGGWFALYGLPELHHHKEGHHTGNLPVAQPWRETVTIKQDYVAQIEASQHIELRSFEKGYLQQSFTNEGQMVKEGQKLFQIMPLITKAEFKKAKAEYDLAKLEYENTALLKKNNVVSPNELGLAKARLDKAKAEMELAQTHLDFTTIKAPFDGIIDRFYVRLGSLIDEGELLTNLSDNRTMWVYFNVSETDYLEYMERKKTAGDVPVTLMLANGKEFAQKGTIDTIEADFNNETGNVAFRATFPNPEGLLRHGETGSVIIAETHENALLIPQKATFEILDKKFVYVVDEEGKVASREIMVEHDIPHFFVISDGLNEQEYILLEGIGKVHSGQIVETHIQPHAEIVQSLNLPVE